MAMPVGTPCAAPGESTTRSTARRSMPGVFGRSMRVMRQHGVGMKFLDADSHGELPL